MKAARRLSQSGFSLVEILLVLAIIAVLGIAAFIIFSQVRDANRAHTESQNLTTIIVGVRNLYANRADYNGLTTGIANQAHIFPSSMNDKQYGATDPVSHLGNGLVDVEPWGANEKRFAVIYRDVPIEICIKIAQNYGKNVDEVQVNGVTVKAFGELGSDPGETLLECNRNELSEITFIQK